MQEINCPQCKTAIKAENMNLKIGVANCQSCNKSFYIDGPRENSKINLLNEAVQGVDVANKGSYLQITRRWFSPVFVLLFIFAAIWNGFLLVLYFTLVAKNTPFTFAYIFPLFHVALGVGIGYFSVAGLINKTIFVCSPNHLKISHQPLPWTGAGEWSAADIEQLYIEERVGSKGSRSLRLCIKLKNSKKIFSVGTFISYEHARKIEQEIEQFLGIKDQLMPKEKLT